MRPKQHWLGLNVVVLALMLTLVVNAQDSAALFESDDCPFPIPAGETEGDTLDCGWLHVPETRGDPNSNEVSLAVAIIHSPSAQTAPDPLIYLAGGPGGSAILEVEDWVKSPFRARRDIILIDQRGTGFSRPHLDCPEVERSGDEPEQDCYNRLLSEGIDLNAYNSAANAADIEALRLALQLEQVNLYGVSYGTRLALTMMRDHPAGIRSVVLDSVFPPQVAGLDSLPLHGANAIQRLFDQCVGDSACRTAYGDLETTFFRVVDNLNQNPTINENGDEIYGDDVVSQLFEALYITPAIPTLPYAIYLLDGGDYSIGLEMLAGAYSLNDLQLLAAGEDLPEQEYIDFDNSTMTIPDEDSEGMYNSVECNEEVPFNSLSAAEVLSTNLPSPIRTVFLTDVEAVLETCAFWDSGLAGAVENQPVSSDIPTLVLSGSFDPVTPPVWGRAAAETLPNSHVVELAHAGHGLLDAGDCALTIGQTFLENPAAGPDTACVAQIQLEFYALQTCFVTAIETLSTYTEPDIEARTSGQLASDQTVQADRMADDGEFFWFRLPDGAWADEELLEFDGDCLMLPLVE